jgi:micrococcal nuclease
VNVNGTEMNVRLIGMDTPEIHHPSEPVQCYGPEAQAALEDLVLNKEVRLEKDVSDKDQYDRYLRYVWLGDTLVDEYMAQHGYAFAKAYPPDTKYQDRIAAAQQLYTCC